MEGQSLQLVAMSCAPDAQAANDDSSDADDGVTALSSYTDFVAASWLRHDLSLHLIFGEHGVGLLLLPTATRGLAAARDLGWATQSKFEAGRADQDVAAICAGVPAVFVGASSELESTKQGILDIPAEVFGYVSQTSGG